MSEQDWKRDPLGASRSGHAILDVLPRWHDTYFIDLLREAMGGVELDIVWIETSTRQREPLPEEIEFSPWLASPSGCWQVIIKYDACVKTIAGIMPDLWGVPLSTTMPTWALAPFPLDGGHGDPMIPGAWLIDVMCETDHMRHNNLGDVANEHRVARRAHDFKEQDKAVSEAAANKDGWRGLAHDFVDESLDKDMERAEFEKAEAWFTAREADRNNELAGLVVPPLKDGA